MTTSVIAGANIGGNVSTAGSTQYCAICGEEVLQTTEVTGSAANAQDIMRTPGTFSQMYLRLTANSCTSLTFNFRKNAANGNQTISVPSSFTGAVSDVTNADTIAAGDKVDIQSVPSASGTYTQTLVGFCFTSSSGNTVSRLGVHGNANAASTAAAFCIVGGNIQTNYTTSESDQKQTQEIAGTYKNLGVNVTTAPTNTGGGTFVSRKNGAAGALSASIPKNTTTGWKEDTSSSDSVAATDQYNLEFPSAATSLAVCAYAIDFITTNGYFMLVCGRSGKALVPASSTTYYNTLSAFPSTNTTESAAQQALNGNFILSNLTVYVPSNTSTNSTTVTLRKNGADTALTVTIPANSGTTTVTDSTHSVIVGPTDLLCTSLVTQASSAMTLGHVTVYGRNLIGRTVMVEYEES